MSARKKQISVISGFTKLVQWMDEISKIILLGIMLFIVINILMRRLFNSPITGSYDLVSLFIVIVVVLALANCAVQKGHIAIDFLVDRFPLWIQRLIDFTTNIVCLIFIVLFTYYTAKHAYITAISGDSTLTLKIPYYPFIYATSFGYLLLSVVLLIDLINLFKDVIKR